MAASLSRAQSEPRLQSWLAWLTLERALHLALVALGLALRLANLGRWPLDELGVNTALAAWRTVHGSAWRPDLYAPLPYDLALALTALTRATDAGPRLLSALAGAALVTIPYALRSCLGRRGAVVAAALIALSPSGLYLARNGGGSTVSALALGLMAVAGMRSPVHRRWLTLGATVLALGLASGAGLMTPILAAGLGALYLWLWRERQPAAWQALRSVCAPLGLRQLWALLLTLLLVGSAVLVNPDGLAMLAEWAGYWVRALVPAQSGLAWTHSLWLLALYEGPTLLLAALGAWAGLRAGQRVAPFALGWLALGLLTNVVLGHRGVEWLPDLLLPLTLLAARGAEWLWQRLEHAWSLPEWIALGAIMVAVWYIRLQVANYLHAGQGQVLWLAALALALAVLIGAGYAGWLRRPAAPLLPLALALLIVCTPMLRGAATTLAGAEADPREPMTAGSVRSLELRQMEHFLTTYSTRTAGDPHLLIIAYDASLDPWLAWTLRDYPNLTAAPDARQATAAQAIITHSGRDQVPLAGWVGQSFRLTESWNPADLGARELWRWLWLRDKVGSVTSDWITVWVRIPTPG